MDSQVIDLVTLKPGMTVPLNDHITTRTDEATDFLRIAIGYLSLPSAWGNVLATRACSALLEACRKSKSIFAPLTSLDVEGIISPGNPASMKGFEEADLKQAGLKECDGIQASWSVSFDLQWARSTG
jgi:RimJ/RimL family protein N-acetyltransferase